MRTLFWDWKGDKKKGTEMTENDETTEPVCEGLSSGENRFLGDGVDFRNSVEDGVERADADGIMVGHGKAMVRRRFGLQNDVASDLVDLLVAVMLKIGRAHV